VLFILFDIEAVFSNRGRSRSTSWASTAIEMVLFSSSSCSPAIYNLLKKRGAWSGMTPLRREATAR